MKDTPFYTGLVDLNGIPLNEGDSIRFAYIDPVGNPYKDDIDEDVFKIEFTHGLFIARKEKNPAIWTPLYQHVETRDGEYISNYGYPIEFVNNTLLAVKVS